MRKEEWKGHIEAQASSGKSVAQYCRDNNLTVSGFSYHRDRQEGRFVQVTGKEQIEISIPGGATLRVPGSQIETVLRALRKV